MKWRSGMPLLVRTVKGSLWGDHESLVAKGWSGMLDRLLMESEGRGTLNNVKLTEVNTAVIGEGFLRPP